MRTIALVAPMLVASIAGAQTPNRCSMLQPDDSAALLSVQRFVADMGHAPAIDSLRRTIGVGGVPSSDVIRVTDDTTCARALAARATFRAMTDDGRPIRLFRAGDRYFVEEIGSREWRVMWVFDRSWKHVSNLAL